MKHFLPILIYISAFFQLAEAQNLAKSPRTSYFTYIYKISNAEAKQFYKQSKLPTDERLFHSLVDSFPHDSTYRHELPIGHYLFAYAEGGKLKYELETMDNLDLKILNNKADLSLILYDSLGNLVENANIHLKHKRIPFDKKSRTYRLAKTNRAGLLMVDYQGFTSYHQIEKRYKNSRFKRIKNTIIYNPPMRYILFPYFWLKRRFQEIKYSFKNRPYGFVRKIAGIFNADIREDIRDEKYENYHERFKGYLAFNKPMYLPKDTVKLKAMILTKKGKPLSEELEVWLTGYSTKDKKIAKLKPYQPGFYNYELVLHDSLNLKLDYNYSIEFRHIK